MALPLTRQSAEQTARDAGAALQRGDARLARALLERLVDGGVATAQIWMMLGEASRQMGDRAGQEKAADALLANDPMLIRALLWKGDCRLGDGDRRAASSFYRAALRQADAVPALPAALHAPVAAAREAVARLDADYAAALDQGLAARGIVPDRVSARFARSLALMTGKEDAALDLQQPSSFYFADLPQRRFFEREEFAWAAAVEAATAAITRELDAALADRDAFRPYLTHDARRPQGAPHELMDNPAWSALHLTDCGEPTTEIAARFPATLAALEQSPLCRIPNRSPTIMFSRLAPGARIAPHHGAVNTRLICHLPLIVPGPGALSVAGEARSWDVGKLLIFDDSIEHAAWNDADADRIVLIFDVWRPELSAAERDAVKALFASVDAFA